MFKLYNTHMSTREIILPTYPVSSVDDIEAYLSSEGPWPTKSGGSLHLHAEFGELMLREFLKVEPSEAALLPHVQLGLRSFTSSGIPVGEVGAMHFHRIRKEVLSVVAGSLSLKLEDIYGGIEVLELNQETRAVYIPPFIAHTYRVTGNTPASLSVVANTLYSHEDPRTHDVFDLELFGKMQENFRAITTP